MTERVNELERIAFWDEIAKQDKGYLKGKKLLIMSSGKQDAIVGQEAAQRLVKLEAAVLVGGSSDVFIHSQKSGEYAYMAALDDVDAVIIISPEQSPDDNGMIQAMKSVTSKALAFGDTSDLLPGMEMPVKTSGISKVAVINPRKNVGSMSFLRDAAGGKHEIGANMASANLIEGLKRIINK